MQRFITTLKEVNKFNREISEELKESTGRSSVIANSKLEEIYPELVKPTTKEFIKAIWTNMLTKASRKMTRTWVNLFKQLDSLLKIIYPNKLTLRDFLSDLRKPLKDAKWDQEIYKQSIVLMGMNLNESKEIAKKYKEDVEFRNINRGSKPPIYVEDIFSLLDELINSQNAYDLTLAVELATGSRSIEVFKVSQYSVITNYPEQILIKGIAKDKSGNKLENVILTRNLVHLNSKQIIDAIEKIRSLINVTGDNKKISQRTNKHLNAKFKEYVIPLIEKNAAPEQKQTEDYMNYIDSFTSHKTRYIYGNTSYLIYAKPKNIPLETYIQKQLGHQTGDATRSYLGVNIRFKNKPNVNNQVKVNEVKENIQNGNIETLDLRKFRNSFSRAESTESKVNKIVDAIKFIKNENKMKLPTQAELGRLLGFGASIMCAGYKKARDEGLVNNFNTTSRNKN